MEELFATDERVGVRIPMGLHIIFNFRYIYKHGKSNFN